MNSKIPEFSQLNSPGPQNAPVWESETYCPNPRGCGMVLSLRPNGQARSGAVTLGSSVPSAEDNPAADEAQLLGSYRPKSHEAWA